MSNVFLTPGLLQAAAPGPAGGDIGSMISTAVMFGGVFLVFYFLMIRPQNKKQKEMKKMLEALKKGDRVQTIGGLRGTVWQVKEETLILKCDDDTKLEFVRSAISNVIEQQKADAPEAKADSEKSAKESDN